MKAISKLLVSYGNQLEWAYLSKFTERSMKDVAKSCRNARFRLHKPQRELLLPALNLFGDKLEIISAILENHNGDTSRYTAAWNSCVNLRVLILWVRTVQQIEAFIAGFNMLNEEMEKICRRLKRILIKGNAAAISNLLASCGNQLDWAYLSGFVEVHLKYVAEASTNARFQLEVPSSGVPALNLLAHQLDNISVHLRDEDDADMNQVAAAWNRCTRAFCENGLLRATPDYLR